MTVRPMPTASTLARVWLEKGAGLLVPPLGPVCARLVEDGSKLNRDCRRLHRKQSQPRRIGQIPRPERSLWFLLRKANPKDARAGVPTEERYANEPSATVHGVAQNARYAKSTSRGTMAAAVVPSTAQYKFVSAPLGASVAATPANPSVVIHKMAPTAERVSVGLHLRGVEACRIQRIARTQVLVRGTAAHSASTLRRPSLHRPARALIQQW